jgi:hypothetical protein
MARIKIRPYTHKELAAMYRVSWITLQKWINLHSKKIGRKCGHFYNGRQVRIIFECIGPPEIEIDFRDL